MKLLPFILAALFTATLHATPKKAADPFNVGLRETWVAYEKGDNEAVTTKLKELLKIIEDKSAKKVADVLPEKIDPWKGESLKREDLSIAGGAARDKDLVGIARKLDLNALSEVK